jgi:ABC-type sugar transport system ATPase subunit
VVWLNSRPAPASELVMANIKSRGDMNDIAIELKGIDKKFGLVHANKNINMKVRKGTIHGIIGENGAGKSTLMSHPLRLLSGRQWRHLR